MIISVENSAWAYQFFFLTGFAISFIYILLSLIRLKKLNAFYLAITSTSFLFFVIGTKLFTLADAVFGVSGIHQTGFLGQMAIGGIVLSLIPILIAHKFLNLSSSFLRIYSLGLLLGLFVQKPGCLLAGCCHAYYPGPINMLSTSGGEYFALPLVEMVLYGVLFLIVYRRVSLRGIQCLGLVLFLISIAQFTLEFSKLADQTIAFSGQFLGIKVLQWIYLLIAFGAILILTSKEKPVRKYTQTEQDRMGMIIMLVNLIILVASQDFLYNIEVIAVNVAFLPGVTLIIARLISDRGTLKYLPFSLLIILICFFMMGQTIAPRPIKTYSYNALGIGVKGGQAKNYIVHDTDPDNCGGVVGSNAFLHQTSMGSAEFSRTTGKVFDEKRFTEQEFGANIAFGKHTETVLLRGTQTGNFNQFIFNPYYRADSRWAEIKIGLHLGQFSHLLMKRLYEKNSIPVTGTKEASILPQFSFRLGPKELVYVKYDFFDEIVSPLPEIGQNLIIGSGLGSWNQFNLELGASLGSSDALMLKFEFPIVEQFRVSALWRNDVTEGRGDTNNYNSFALRVKYLMNRKTIDLESN